VPAPEEEIEGGGSTVVLNKYPYYIGQTPFYAGASYSTAITSFTGLVADLGVYPSSSLSAAAVASLASKVLPAASQGIKPIDEVYVLSVLAVILKGIKEMVDDGEPTSPRDASRSTSTGSNSSDSSVCRLLGSSSVVSSLFTIIKYCNPLIQSAALRVCKELLPMLEVDLVEAQARACALVAPEEDFVSYLVESIGSEMSSMTLNGSSRDATRSDAETEYGSAMERLSLLRAFAVSENPDWESVLARVFSECIESTPSLLSEVAEHATSETLAVDCADRRLKKVYGLIAFLGGAFTGMHPGAKAIYKVKNSELLEECTILGPASIPKFDEKQDAEMKEIWKGSEVFGDAISIVLLSQPGKVLIVPRSSIAVHSVSSKLHAKLSVFLSDKMEVSKIADFFGAIVAIDATDMRPQPLPMLQEVDVEEVIESSHPYDNLLDIYKDFKIEGSKQLTISFDPRSASEAHYDYVCFFKTQARSDYWGAERYTGRQGSQNWPGCEGRPELIIPADNFVFHFHSDGSNNDWGYLIKIKGRTNKLAPAHPLPALPNLSLLRHIKMLGMKAFSSTLHKSSWLVAPARSLSTRLVQGALAPAPIDSDISDPNFKVLACYYAQQLLKDGIQKSTYELFDYTECTFEAPSTHCASYINAEEILSTLIGADGSSPRSPRAIGGGGVGGSELDGGLVEEEEEEEEQTEVTFRKKPANWPKGYKVIRIPKAESDELLKIRASPNPSAEIVKGVSKNSPLLAHDQQGEWIMVEILPAPMNGPEFSKESSHPYPDWADTFETIEVEGAISYSLTFDNQSLTEQNYDFVTFYVDESRSAFHGEQKYTGGRGGSTRNYPGTEGRPPLVINAKKFYLHFHSDGSNNDWGYKINIIPVLPAPASTSNPRGWMKLFDRDLVYAERDDDIPGSVPEYIELPSFNSSSSSTSALASGAASGSNATRFAGSIHPMYVVADSVTFDSSPASAPAASVSSAAAAAPTARSPIDLLRSEVTKLEASVSNNAAVASIGYSLDSIAYMLENWPAEIPFTLDFFGGINEFISIINLSFHKTGRDADAAKDDGLLKAIKRKILQLIRGAGGEEICSKLVAFSSFQLKTNNQKSADSKSKKVVTEPKSRGIMKIIETPHNYADNSEIDYSVTIPKASRLLLVFDSRCATEANCDYMTIVDGNGAQVGPEKCTGRANDPSSIWPGVGSTPPVIVNGDSVRMHFHSDG